MLLFDTKGKKTILGNVTLKERKRFRRKVGFLR